MIQIETFQLGSLAANCYVVWDDTENKCMIIDPGGDPAEVAAFCRDRSLNPSMIIATHGHFDHIAGTAPLKKEWDVPFCVSSLDEIHYRNMKVQAELFGCGPVAEAPSPDIDLCDKNEIGGGRLLFSVIPTPGHSQGSVTFRLQDFLFCGDSVFRGSIGRTDIPGGDMDQLMDSIRSGILSIESGLLLPGHGPATDVASEKKYNPFFADI